MSAIIIIICMTADFYVYSRTVGQCILVHQHIYGNLSGLCAYTNLCAVCYGNLLMQKGSLAADAVMHGCSPWQLPMPLCTAVHHGQYYFGNLEFVRTKFPNVVRRTGSRKQLVIVSVRCPYSQISSYVCCCVSSSQMGAIAFHTYPCLLLRKLVAG